LRTSQTLIETEREYAEKAVKSLHRQTGEQRFVFVVLNVSGATPRQDLPLRAIAS
jgi:hypothetical protein